jgi:hypothetical protein
MIAVTFSEALPISTIQTAGQGDKWSSCTIEHFHERRMNVGDIDTIARFPFDRRKVTNGIELRRLALRIAARQTITSYLTDLGFFRYLVLTHGK